MHSTHRRPFLYGHLGSLLSDSEVALSASRDQKLYNNKDSFANIMPSVTSRGLLGPALPDGIAACAFQNLFVYCRVNT